MQMKTNCRHPGESRDPRFSHLDALQVGGQAFEMRHVDEWVPAFAGMTE
jgi:hypothetical protein